jgi:putative hemolysin
MNKKKFIDTEEIIRSKSPKLLKRLPRFVINYIKRTIHEDDVNDFMAENEHLKGEAFCTSVIESFHLDVKIIGEENIPRSGGVVFACNHPLGGMDAMAIVSGLKGIRNDVKFIVNDILLYLTNLKDLFVGVNKYGKNATSSLQIVDELFASENAVFIFPAGLVSRKKKGIIKDLEWKKTFITRAKKHNRTVVPVHVDGELSNFFYRLSNLRTFLGIQTNIELFYLSDETFKQKNKKIQITFGKPIPASDFNDEKSDYEWAQEVKSKVYALKE